MQVITSINPLRVTISLLRQMRPLSLAGPTGTSALVNKNNESSAGARAGTPEQTTQNGKIAKGDGIGVVAAAAGEWGSRG